MPLKNGKVNPLEVFKIRKVNFPAAHFTYTTLINLSHGQIDQWIKENLSGRYYIGRCILLDHTNTLVFGIKIGFENSKELSFFSLSYSGLE